MNQEEKSKNIYFGGGCFWCIEAAFSNLKGVVKVVNGYAGGTSDTANYQTVSTGKTNHAEICKITYKPHIISIDILLEVFFVAHDPTQLNRQGNDIGRQYRSIMLYTNMLEKEKIENYIKKLEIEEIYKNIETEIAPLTVFYKAEQYHQNYFKLNPNKPYCSLIINPKIQKLKHRLKKYYH
tara:strand:+ start:107 stop:649 length:543 start_codon:yes stop_codon:yes gene_type:complete